MIRDVRGADLRDVRAATAHQGPLQLVEVELALANRDTRWTGADLALRLPPDARVVRLALEVGGVLREAAVLPRADASAIYGDIVRRLRDPALLERDVDDSLRLRVAPIPAQSETGVVFSYVGLERAGDRPIAARSDERWIVRAGLPAPTLAPAPKRLRVLLDTSASMHPRFDRHLQRTRELLAALARQYDRPVELELVAFDQSLEVVHDGPLAAIPEFVWTGLRGRGAFGATRGADALKAPTRADRVLVVTDGRFTEPVASLLAGGKAMARAGVERLDVVTLTERPASPTPPLQALHDHVRLPQRGLVEWRQAPLEPLARRLAGEVRDIRVDVPGAAWWSPRTVELGVEDELILLVRSPATPAPVLRGLPGGDVPLALAPEDAAGPLFERLWQALLVDAELAEAATDPEALADLAARTAELGVLTPLTAFLALESEQQEKQYGVRRVDAPIVTIDGGEVVVRPTGVPLRGARLASVPAGAAGDPGIELNQIGVELERRARELHLKSTWEEAVSALYIIRVLFKGGEIGGLDGLRAELDALLNGLTRERSEDSRTDERLAFLRPFAQRLVDSNGDECHFEELENALRTFAVGAEPHGAGAEPPLVPSDRLPFELTSPSAVQLAGALARSGRPRDAVRVLGSLADLDGPLAAAVALDTLPEGRTLATALLRELIDDRPRASRRSPRQVLFRRLLAASLARSGAFAEAFALLAGSLPAIPFPYEHWTFERMALWVAQTSAAADLRLLGARWAAAEPRRAAAIARDVKRLAGKHPTEALTIVIYYTGERNLQLRAFDGRGSVSTLRTLGGRDEDNDLRTAALRFPAAELPSALEIGFGRRGDWVRVDMVDTTGRQINVTSQLLILSGPRTKLDLPAHLLGRSVCPPAKQG